MADTHSLIGSRLHKIDIIYGHVYGSLQKMLATIIMYYMHMPIATVKAYA